MLPLGLMTLCSPLTGILKFSISVMISFIIIYSFSLHLYGENITDIEKETARELLKANADNYDSLVIVPNR